MERKVNRAKGERTLEEKKDLENEIALAETEYKKVLQEFTALGESLKKLDDELRAVEKRVINNYIYFFKNILF